MSATAVNSDGLSPQSPLRPEDRVSDTPPKTRVRPAFQTALSLLKETNYQPPSVRDEQEEVAQYHVPKEAGHHARQH